MKHRPLVVVSVLLASQLLMSGSVLAQSISDEKKATIVQSCVSSQTVMQRIRHNDAATRINRGQGYETIASRLMTPLNSRTTSQGYDEAAALLINSTKKYRDSLETFKENYRLYDNTLLSALRTKCQSQPEKFYTTLQDARSKRQDLSKDITVLSTAISEYRQNVENLKTELQ